MARNRRADGLPCLTPYSDGAASVICLCCGSINLIWIVWSYQSKHQYPCSHTPEDVSQREMRSLLYAKVGRRLDVSPSRGIEPVSTKFAIVVQPVFGQRATVMH